MKQWKNNNIGMKILSVFIAVLIWLFVANTNDPVVSKRIVDIPVEIINEEALTDQGYAYEVTEGSAVTITVRGKRSIVDGLTAMDFDAVADFSKLSTVFAVPIDVSAKKYADQLEITVGSVNTMKINTDEIISASVPVNIVVNGDPAEGYAVGNMNGTPNLVRVTGPQNLLKNAKEIRAEVDLKGITHDITTTVKPVLYDKNDKKIKSKQIVFDTTSIGVSVELWRTKAVNIKMELEGKPASGYALVNFDYEPKQITVAAPDDVLADLGEITLDPVSLSGLTDNYEKDIDITEAVLPENVVLADDVTDIKARANIEKVTTRQLNYQENDITVKGKRNLKVTFGLDNEYVLTISGARTLVNKMKITDFAPWINVEDLEEGQHRLAVHVKDVEGVTVDSTSYVTVTLGE